MQALAQLINYILDAYIFILLLRFILQKLGASWHNPVTKFVVTLSNPVVKVTRRVIPGFKGFDFAILVVAYLIELLELYIVNWMRLGFTLDFGGVAIIGITALATKIIYVVMFSIIIWAFLSWFTTAQQNPIAEVTGVIAFPWLRLARRFIPMVGGLDLSPIALLIIFYLILSFVLTPITRIGLQIAVGVLS